MLRSFEALSRAAAGDLLVSVDAEHASLAGSGAYAKPWHWHDCLMFILPSRGALELKHEGKREGVWLSHDRFAVVPVNRAHETRAGIGDGCHLALYVTASLLRRLERDIGSLSEFHRRTQAVTLVRRTALIRDLQSLAMQDGDAAFGRAEFKRSLSMALLMQCFSEVMAGETVPNGSARGHGMALVDELQQYLRGHVDEELPLDVLAERFGVSRRHITRLFREGTGISVGEFQQRTRLQAALQLLQETDLPIGEIAFRVGFDSGAALAHAMRRVHGRSPSVLRREANRSQAHTAVIAERPHVS